MSAIAILQAGFRVLFVVCGLVMLIFGIVNLAQLLPLIVWKVLGLLMMVWVGAYAIVQGLDPR